MRVVALASILFIHQAGCVERFEAEVTAEPSSTPLRIIAWNVESGGNDPDVIARQLIEFSGCDLFALSEVRPESQDIYAESLPEFSAIKGVSGGSDDRLMILYKSSRLDLKSHRELDDLNDGRHRSPLLATFVERTSGREFHFITVHLARGNAGLRQQQAAGLREFARRSKLPILSAGDFNFDYVFDTHKGNAAFDEFLVDGVWKWIRPDPLVDNNWYDADGDGSDDFPGSMLDFAFVAGAARDWKATSRVIVRENDFPDDDTTSDHRPTELVVTIPRE